LNAEGATEVITIYNAAEHLTSKSYVLMHKNVFLEDRRKDKTIQKCFTSFFDCFFFKFVLQAFSELPSMSLF